MKKTSNLGFQVLSLLVLTVVALLGIPAPANGAQPSEVLVVCNANNPNSVNIANNYVKARSIPTQNLLCLNLPSQYTPDTNAIPVNEGVAPLQMSNSDYMNYVVTPVYNKIQALKQAGETINYIVLSWFPETIGGNANTTNSNGFLSLSDNLAISAYNPTNSWAIEDNPFYSEQAPFSSEEYGMYLVTILDGWSPVDANNLITNSVYSTPPSGLFYFQDVASSLDMQVTQSMQTASEDLSMSGFPTDLVWDSAGNNLFSLPPGNQPLAGYYSFGVHDITFNPNVYDSFQFAQGAIADMVVSTTGAYLRSPPPAGAQNQIAQLLHDGLTGGKGYVTEPYTAAFADPDLMFTSYTSGANLAEALYSASPLINWKDVYVGDPLCSPYAYSGVPVIITQPTNLTVYNGATFTFSVGVKSGLPVSYQWNKNGVAVTGETNNYYTSLGGAQASDSGTYTVTISNASGSVTSSAVRLTVLPLTVTFNSALIIGSNVIANPAGGSASITQDNGASYNGQGINDYDTLTITPDPATGYTFNGFSNVSANGSIQCGTPATGACFGSNIPANSIEVEVTGPTTITVNFKQQAAINVLSGLTANAVSGGQVSLSWDTYATTPATTISYTLVRTTDGINYSIVAKGIETTSYTDSPSVEGIRYYYRVEAINAQGTVVAISSSAYVTPNEPPPTPTGLTATAGNNQVTLTWNASTNTSSYTLQGSTDGRNYTNIASGINTISYTNTSLTNGTMYYYEVQAVNTVGPSAFSAPVSATPQPPPPLAPATLTASVSNDQVTLTWSASSGAASYTVQRIANGTYAASTVGTGITGLTFTDNVVTSGGIYYYEVQAVNAGGASSFTGPVSVTLPPSPNNPTPGAPTKPSVPQMGTAVAGNALAIVSFSPPANNGGSTITSYTVTSSPGGLTGTGPASPVTVANLTNGTAYTFIVQARNAAGTGAASGASNSVTPIGSPSAPTIGTATAGNSQAAVSFTPPSNNGGSTITSYTVTSSPGGLTGTGPASPVTVANLTNGTAYTFIVQATNTAGTGAASGASNSVTPALPSAEYALNITALNGTVTVSPQPVKGAYAAGTVVTLTAGAGASGYIFGSWSGDATGKTNSVSITMTKNMNVTATFNVNQAPVIKPGAYAPITPTTFPVTLTFSNTTVTDDGLGIPNGYLLTTWSGPANATFANKNQVQTTATFDQAGVYVLTLTAFDGQLTSSKQISITINGYNLTVNSANGTVTVNPPSQYGYAAGTVVTLTASPSVPGYNFSSWSNNVTPVPGNPLSATVTMNANTTVTANFSSLTANAGSNQTQTIVLPGSVNLNGSVKGATSSRWSVDPSSPGSGTVSFTNPASPVTSAQFSKAGTYVLDLTAFNGTQTPLISQVTINVIAGYTLNITSPNGSVVKSPNQSIYTAGTTVTLTATPGNSSYQFLTWSGDISSTQNPVTVTVNNNMNITAVLNGTPSVNAGGNQIINMPATGNPPIATANLYGSVRDAGVVPPGTLITSWKLVSYTGSGTGNVTFGTTTQTLTTVPNTFMSVNSTVNFSDPGIYVIGLSANDGQLTGSSTVTFTVNAANMHWLVVNTSNAAYGNVTVSSSQASVQFGNETLYPTGTQITLTANPVDSTVGFASWTGNIGGITPSVTFTMNGNETVTANFKSLNTAPVVSAGASQNIALPSGATLAGTVTDDGLPLNPGAVTTTWSKYSGPGNVTFGTPTQTLTTIPNTAMAVSSTANFSLAGTYVLKLSATDGALTSQPAYTTVTVAGLPTYSLTVTGPNGLALQNGTVIQNPNLSAYPSGTVVTLIAQPVSGYVLVNWGGAAVASATNSSVATVLMNANETVTANFAVMTPPIVMTGVYDSSVVLPNTLTLNATVTDTTYKGTVVTTWSVSPNSTGPGAVNFSNVHQLNSTVSFTKAGTYILTLTASNGQLSTSKDVLVTVVSG